MSHLANTEILENLFEEELNNIYFYILEQSEGDWKPSKKDREEMHEQASQRAKKKFEEMSQP